MRRRGCKSLAEAIAVAESLIELLRDTRRDRGKRVEEDDHEEREASHQPRVKAADHGKDKAQSKWESRGDNCDGGKLSRPFKCFLCDKEGHTARYCPSC